MEQLFYRTWAIIRYIMILLWWITVLWILISQIRHSEWFTAIYFAVKMQHKIKNDKLKGEYINELRDIIQKYKKKDLITK